MHTKPQSHRFQRNAAQPVPFPASERIFARVFEFEPRCDWATTAPIASNFAPAFAKNAKKSRAPLPSIALHPHTNHRAINNVQGMGYDKVASPTQESHAIDRISNPENYVHRHHR
jgi:hypothetical protein